MRSVYTLDRICCLQSTFLKELGLLKSFPSFPLTRKRGAEPPGVSWFLERCFPYLLSCARGCQEPLDDIYDLAIEIFYQDVNLLP